MTHIDKVIRPPDVDRRPFRKSSVLFVPSTLEVGGSETKVVRIANALSSSGCRAGIAYLNPPETLRDKIDTGVAVIHLERRGKFSFRSLFKLRRFIQGRYSAVVAVNYYPLLYVVPLRLLFFRHRRPKIYCVMNTTEFFGFQRVFGVIYAPFLRRCDMVIFGCKFQKAMWIDKYRLNAERCIHIYNGVDANYFGRAESSASALSLRVELGIPEGSIIIGSVGRLAPEKNFDLLLKSVVDCRESGQDVYVLLVGDGEEKARLTDYSKSLGIGRRTRFLGSLADVRPALAAMDVFVLPSKTETFSNAALEAMAMGCPVVLSNVGGAAEMVENSQSGFLFESGSVPELTMILKVLNESAELRARIGAAARQRILDQFQLAAMVEKYRQLIGKEQA